MKLYNRISLLNILPREGSFEELIIIEDIKKKVNISQEEIKELEIKTLENGNITWNEKKDNNKEIDFSEAEKNIISNLLEKLSNEKKLTVELLDLYKEFKK